MNGCGPFGSPSLVPKLASNRAAARVKQLRLAADVLVSGGTEVDVPRGADDIGHAGDSLARLARNSREQIQRTQGLVRLTEGVNAVMTLEDALEFLYYSFRALIPYDRIGCSLLVDNGESLECVWIRTRAAQARLCVGYKASRRGGSMDLLLASGEPRIINDLQVHLEKYPLSQSTRLIVAEGMRASLTCPIIVMGSPIGCLFFSSFHENTYRHEHTSYYLQISGVVGMVVERTRLYQEVSRARDELELANAKLQLLVDIDGLTLIPNRRALDQRVESEWRRALRNRTVLSVLMVDVDEFKEYNDSYGHLAGDVCLRQIAAALSTSLRRAGDFVGRFGGEEFTVVLPSADSKQALSVAARCLESVRALQIRHQASRTAPFVTLSIGVVSGDGNSGLSADELLNLADQALYRAKEAGRNRVWLSGDADVVPDSRSLRVL